LFYTNLSEPRMLMVGINDVPDQDFLRVRRLEKKKNERIIVAIV
jgi:hypothetical protein